MYIYSKWIGYFKPKFAIPPFSNLYLIPQYLSNLFFPNHFIQIAADIIVQIHHHTNDVLFKFMKRMRRLYIFNLASSHIHMINTLYTMSSAKWINIFSFSFFYKSISSSCIEIPFMIFEKKINISFKHHVHVHT